MRFGNNNKGLLKMSTTTNFSVRRCITHIFNQEEEGADKPDKKRHRKDTLTDSEEKGTSLNLS